MKFVSDKVEARYMKSDKFRSLPLGKPGKPNYIYMSTSCTRVIKHPRQILGEILPCLWQINKLSQGEPARLASQHPFVLASKSKGGAAIFYSSTCWIQRSKLMRNHICMFIFLFYSYEKVLHAILIDVLLLLWSL